MKAILRRLTRDTFSWLEVLLLIIAITAITGTSLPWWGRLAASLAAGIVIGAISGLLQHAIGQEAA